jgi:tRNA threonylcarbamoyladenosine modification (KEOPS) complex  Pcc1 subunit
MLTSKKCRAEIRVSTSSRRVAISVSDALAPDLERLPKGDGSAEISLQGTVIVFVIETPDLPTLRASIHSFLMLSDAALRCLSV